MIQLFHVTKRYTQDSLALDDVSFQLDKGDFAFLTGHSGAGKSTLMRLLFAAERPTSGQVVVAGENTGRLPVKKIAQLRRRVSVVFQDFKLLEGRTVFDNVAFSLDVLGRPRREIHERVRAVLRDVGLEHPLEGDAHALVWWRAAKGCYRQSFSDRAACPTCR